MATGFEDPYLTCPLDEVHRIRKSRMQCHLTKCLKNHKLTDKIKCPFNPLHIIYPNEMTHHMTVCESNASVAVQRYDRSDQKCFSGIISAQDAMAQLEAAFGSFSNEVEYKHTIDTPSYNPIQANIDNPLFRSLNCESKSKRKEFRFRERQRIAAIEAEKGKKIIECTSEDRPIRDLKPIRSRSALATDANDKDGFKQSDSSTIYNYPRPQGIMCENEEQKLEILSNGQLPVDNDLDEISQKLELLSQKENEIHRQKQELMKKLSGRSSQIRITNESYLEKTSDESAGQNPFTINGNEMMTNKSNHSLTSERAFVPVESNIDIKSAGAVAHDSSTPAFELSSHLQSSAWNVVTKRNSNSSNNSTASKITISKPVEVPIIQPIAKLATQTLSIEKSFPVDPSSKWTTVSRSRKGSNLAGSSIRKPKIKSGESSPIPEADWRKATGSKELSGSEPPSASFDIKMKPREPSSTHETTPWRKVDVPKEPLSITESVQRNVETKLREPSPVHEALSWQKEAASKEASPADEATPWNKVATLKETSTTSESPPWTVLVRSKKVSSSQQCTQWKLAPEVTETSVVRPLSPANTVHSLKTSELPQSISSDKKTLPASVSSSIDTQPMSRLVLKDSSQKYTLVSTTTSSSSVSSSYNTMAKITKDKASENLPLKTNVSSNEFLPIPHRVKISSLFHQQDLNRLVAPGAGRGIIHAVDEIKLQKKNDLISRRLRPGSASSFCSSFDQTDIEGVYGYEETG